MQNNNTDKTKVLNNIVEESTSFNEEEKVNEINVHAPFYQFRRKQM